MARRDAGFSSFYALILPLRSRPRRLDRVLLRAKGEGWEVLGWLEMEVSIGGCTGYPPMQSQLPDSTRRASMPHWLTPSPSGLTRLPFLAAHQPNSLGG